MMISSRMIRRTFLLLFCILPFAFLSAQKNKHDDQEIKLKDLEDHIKHEEYLPAIPLLEKYVEQNPNDAQGHFLLGKAYFKMYRKEKALPHFKRATLLNKNVDEELPYYYGMTLHYNLDLNGAINQYQYFLLTMKKKDDPRYLEVERLLQQCVNARKKLKEHQKGLEVVKIRNMGDSINTPFSEHSPVISANDSILLYTSRRPGNVGSPDTVPNLEYYDEDIYISYLVDGEWSQAKNIGKQINTTGHDATVSLTYDGQRLYLYRHDKGGSVYETDFDEMGQQWTNPKIIGHPVKSKYHEPSVFMTADSSILFFSSDRPGGMGGDDIYFVRRDKKGKWGEPVNPGPPINTPYDEDAPFLHLDGRTFYYSSNGMNSIGGYDIFYSEWMDDTTWSEPINLGLPINTADDDIYFVVSGSGKLGYYSSGKDEGYGEKDIYEIRFPYFPYPSKVMKIVGNVTDSLTEEALACKILLIDETISELVDTLEVSESDSFDQILFAGHDYAFIILKDGYAPVTRHVSGPAFTEDTTIFRQWKLFKPMVKVVEETPPLIVFNIYFDFDSYQLRDESVVELDKIRQILVNDQTFHVKLYGHTDSKGSNAYNQRLSENRAMAGYNWLLDHDTDPERVSYRGLSEDDPADDNESEVGRQYNRRVEFQLFKNNEVWIESEKVKDVRVVE